MAVAIKKDSRYRNNCGIRLHAADLEHSLMKEKKLGFHGFLFLFLYSAVPDLNLAVLKMLIRVCFHDVF